MKNLQPLINKGWTDVRIGQHLSLHKTSVGKLKKGIIKKTRIIGIKKRLNEREFYPLWKHVGTEYIISLAQQVSRKIAWLYPKTEYEDILDHGLTWLYSRGNTNFLTKIKKIPDKVGRRKFTHFALYRTI